VANRKYKMLMLVMGSIIFRSLTLLCLIVSSEGGDPLVAHEYSLHLIRSNMGVVVKKKKKKRRKTGNIS
jgi:hypothetical protein